MTSRQLRLASIFAMGGMMLVIATHLIRPILGMLPQEIIFVFGVLPNFGAGLSLPFLMIVLVRNLRRREFTKWNLTPLIVSSLLFSFLGLTAWELFQYKIWGIPMDLNDIIATGFGELCAAGGYFAMR